MNLPWDKNERNCTCLVMSYLSYTGAMMIKWLHTEKNEHEKMYAKMQRNLEVISEFPQCGNIADWEIVWGPAAYTLPYAILQDNMMFVARQKSTPERYIIAVRGTNPAALWDWVSEDLIVAEKVAWSNPQAGAAGAKISRSAELGLDTLLNKMVPVGDTPGSGLTLEQFLEQAYANGNNDFYFTGHSLGGTLAPILALKMQEDLEASPYASKGNAIASITYAGPTAGNREFADYFNEKMKDRAERIYCQLDLVPHVWQTDEMEKLPGLYSSGEIKPTSLELDSLDWLLKRVKDYRHMGKPAPFQGQIYKEGKSYLSQVIYQHIFSYPVHFQMHDLAKLIPVVG